MVFEELNDMARSPAFMLLNGLILSLVGIRHVFMPAGSLVDVLAEPVLQEQVRLLVARGVGVVVAAGGLGMIGNVLEDVGVY